MQEPSEVEQSPASSPTANVQLLATLESVSEDASHSANQANLRKGKRFFESRGALKPWNADNHFRLKKQRASWAVLITAYLCLRVPVVSSVKLIKVSLVKPSRHVESGCSLAWRGASPSCRSKTWVAIFCQRARHAEEVEPNSRVFASRTW